MNLFPIVIGTPKELKSGITYSVCANGIFEIRTLPGDGYVCTKIDGIKGLPEAKEEIRFLRRKIPASIFWEIVKFFSLVESRFGEKLEAYILIGYNQSEDKYFLWTPPHMVTMGSVKYDIEQFYKLSEHSNCFIVADAHLHPGSMGAFWSGTDDKDDCRDRYSIVMSKVNDIYPDCKCRFSTSFKKFDIKMTDLFESNNEDYTYDTDKGLNAIQVNRNTNSGSKCGYVPQQGRSLFAMLKQKKSKGFTIADLMGKDW